MEDRRACASKSARGIEGMNAVSDMDADHHRQPPVANSVNEDNFSGWIENYFYNMASSVINK